MPDVEMHVPDLEKKGEERVKVQPDADDSQQVGDQHNKLQVRLLMLTLIRAASAEKEEDSPPDEILVFYTLVVIAITGISWVVRGYWEVFCAS